MEAETGVQQVARARNATINILDCKNLNKNDMAFLIEISAPGGKANDVIADLKAKKVFKKVYTGETEDKPSKSLCVAILDRPGICKAVHDCGVFCLTCPYSEPEADGKWKILVKDSEQLKALLTDLNDQHIEASIGGLSGLRHDDELTSRQTEVLAKAISLGYFEFPRRVSLTELSKEIGIKPSTLSQVLRAAEEKVVARYAADMKITKVTTPSRALFQ